MDKWIVEIEDIKLAHWYTRAELKKMFSNAKKAVEVNTWQGEPKHNGKPVKLYAVEEDK